MSFLVSVWVNTSTLHGFPWGTLARQKDQALGQKQRAPWKTRCVFSCMGHAAFARILDLHCLWQREVTTSPHFTSINSCTLVRRVFAVKKIAPMGATYSTYLHVLRTNFLQRKRCRNECFPPREGWPWLWQSRGRACRRLPPLTNLAFFVTFVRAPERSKGCFGGTYGK
jgi:hypothetical protein